MTDASGEEEYRPEDPPAAEGDGSAQDSDPGLQDGPGDLVESVDEFLSTNEVDQRASDALRDCTPEVQQLVMARGPLVGVRNTSSVVLARIRDAVESQTATAPDEHDDEGPAYVRMRGLPYDATKEDIMVFYEDWAAGEAVDPPAGDDVTIGTGYDGRATGDAFVRFDTNRLAKEAVKDRNRAVMGGRWIELTLSSEHELRRATDTEGRADRREYDDKDYRRDDRGGWEEGRRGGGDDSYGGRGGHGHWGGSRGGRAEWNRGGHADRRDDYGGEWESRTLQRDVEDFIRFNQIDDAAADALSKLSPDLQEAVLRRGDLTTARNPSAALLARIKACRESAAQVRYEEEDRYRERSRYRERDGASPEEVAQFIRANELDERTAFALEDESPQVQRIVIDRGDLRNARNPSSVLLSRLKDAAAEVRQKPQYSDRDRGYDDGGGGSDYRRHSSRRDDDFPSPPRHKGYGGGYSPPPHGRHPRGGDYGDGRRGAMGSPPRYGGPAIPSSGFARPVPTSRDDFVGGYRDDPRARRGNSRPRSRSFRPGWERRSRSRGWRSRSPLLPPRAGGGRWAEQVDKFLKFYDVDERASDDFRRCEREVQDIVMERGLEGIRRPSAGLTALIRDAKREVKGGGKGGGKGRGGGKGPGGPAPRWGGEHDPMPPAPTRVRIGDVGRPTPSSRPVEEAGAIRPSSSDNASFPRRGPHPSDARGMGRDWEPRRRSSSRRGDVRRPPPMH